MGLPADCVDCQLHKIADGLLSGRYSVPRAHPEEGMIVPPKEGDVVFQEGLKPAGFKALIGKGHEEFSTMRQQDSEEFLGHLLKVRPSMFYLVHSVLIFGHVGTPSAP